MAIISALLTMLSMLVTSLFNEFEEKKRRRGEANEEKQRDCVGEAYMFGLLARYCKNLMERTKHCLGKKKL